jgi:hypothetical protein
MLCSGQYIELWVPANCPDARSVSWLIVWYTCAFCTCAWMNDRLWSNDFELVLVRLLALVICFERLLALTTVSYFTYRVASVLLTAYCVRLVA